MPKKLLVVMLQTWPDMILQRTLLDTKYIKYKKISLKYLSNLN